MCTIARLSLCSCRSSFLAQGTLLYKYVNAFSTLSLSFWCGTNRCVSPPTWHAGLQQFQLESMLQNNANAWRERVLDCCNFCPASKPSQLVSQSVSLKKTQLTSHVKTTSQVDADNCNSQLWHSASMLELRCIISCHSNMSKVQADKFTDVYQNAMGCSAANRKYL